MAENKRFMGWRVSDNAVAMVKAYQVRIDRESCLEMKYKLQDEIVQYLMYGDPQEMGRRAAILAQRQRALPALEISDTKEPPCLGKT